MRLKIRAYCLQNPENRSIPWIQLSQRGLPSSPKKSSILRFWRLAVLIQLLINLAPTWESAEVAVVNEEVCVDFSAYVGGVCGFFRVRSVHCVWRDALVLHELNGVLEL